MSKRHVLDGGVHFVGHLDDVVIHGEGYVAKDGQHILWLGPEDTLTLWFDEKTLVVGQPVVVTYHGLTTEFYLYPGRQCDAC